MGAAVSLYTCSCVQLQEQLAYSSGGLWRCLLFVVYVIKCEILWGLASAFGLQRDAAHLEVHGNNPERDVM